MFFYINGNEITVDDGLAREYEKVTGIKLTQDEINFMAHGAIKKNKNINEIEAHVIKAIKDYLLNYKIFAFSTTIEGAVLNEHSYEYGLDYLKRNKKEEYFVKFKNIVDQYPKTDRINLLRLAFKGKTDLLQEYKNIKNNLEAEHSLVIENVMIKKASGWISEFLDNFFELHSVWPENITPNKFERYIEDAEKKSKLIEEFEYNFPEIYFLIEKIMV